MRAFLSSEQVKALTEEKAIIELDVKGFGLVIVNENARCDHCGKPGQTTMPENVKGCMYCQHIDTKNSMSFEEIESFRLVLQAVPTMLSQAKESLFKKYAPRRK